MQEKRKSAMVTGLVGVRNVGASMSVGLHIPRPPPHEDHPSPYIPIQASNNNETKALRPLHFPPRPAHLKVNTAPPKDPNFVGLNCTYPPPPPPHDSFLPLISPPEIRLYINRLTSQTARRA